MDDIRITLEHPSLMPERKHVGDAGVDLKSAEGLVIEPGGIAVVSTGVRLAIPYGYAGFVVVRSGVSTNHGIVLMNQIGVIDHQYRGIVYLPLRNTGGEPFEIHFGDRIAQLVIQRVELPGFDIVEDLPQTARGAGGFGSTGI